MQSGRVYLVGAGPGDPGLLTLRAVECLQQADFVLYDYLTAPRMLAHARPDAEKLCAEDLPGEHPQRWPIIHQRIIAEARAGRTVVHLKGGDPLIFGRGGEEAEALRAAGIDYDIVPGVSAALAAGAYAEIPLTHRARASAVAFVTGHEHPGKANSRLDWDALARFPGTLAIYMGVGRLPIIARELVARGKAPESPAAVVQQASTGGQRTVTGTLATLPALADAAGIASPALMLVGPVVDLKPERSWFEDLPLYGLRVLLTRPRAQAEALARRLELLGAAPIVMPVVDIRPPRDWTPVDAAVQRLRGGQFDWLIFTSANGVRAFCARLAALGLDARVLAGTQLAAIGPATASALERWSLAADFVPAEGLDSERLADLLAPRCRGQRLLIVQAAQGRKLLREQLCEHAKVEVVSAYEQIAVADAAHSGYEQLRAGQLDAVILTSPNVARAFLDACPEECRQRLRGGVHLIVNSQRLKLQMETDGYATTATCGPTDDDIVAALTQLRPGP